MTLNESIVEAAALGWFQVLGYAVLPGPQLAPGEPIAERESFSTLTASSLTPALPRFLPACFPQEHCCFHHAPPSATSP